MLVILDLRKKKEFIWPRILSPDLKTQIKTKAVTSIRSIYLSIYLSVELQNEYGIEGTRKPFTSIQAIHGNLLITLG